MRNSFGKSLIKMLTIVVDKRIANPFALPLVVLSTLVVLQPATAQTFKRVKVKEGLSLTQVAAGGVSVWGIASNGHPYLLKGKQFAPVDTTIPLTQIAVGGGSTQQPDAVWGLDSVGNIYRAAKSGSTWSFSPVAGSLTMVAVGPGYEDNCHPYEVWGLNSGSAIFRYDFCGSKWDQIPGTLCSLAVGGGGIWGNTCAGSVFQFNIRQLQFFPVDSNFKTTSMSVGPDNVYALDQSATPHAYDLVGGFFFELGPIKGFTGIQAGGDGAWMIAASAIVRSDLLGQRLVKVDGPSLTSISVGNGTGVWGLNAAGQVFAFSTP